MSGARYPHHLYVRFTNEDVSHLASASERLDVSRAALMRHIWREWWGKNQDLQTIDDPLFKKASSRT